MRITANHVKSTLLDRALPGALIGVFLVAAITLPQNGLCTQATSDASLSKDNAPITPRVITDIEKWKHPTKAVFLKYGVQLRKVTLEKNHPIFLISFPFDPQSSPNAHKLESMCAELLTANGNWSYTLEAPEDGVAYAVSRNKRTHNIELTNHRIKRS
jgi:hypothetical protein